MNSTEKLMLLFSETSAVTYIFNFIISIRTVSSITEKKFSEIYGNFLINEINSTGGDITGRKAHAQIMFPLKDKKMQGI